MKANKKFRDKEAGVSAVIGVLLMVAITVMIATTVYIYSASFAGEVLSTTVIPDISFMKSYRKLTVISADSGYNWSSFEFNNTENSTKAIIPKGLVKSGQTVKNLTGIFSISFDNQLVGTWEFE